MLRQVIAAALTISAMAVVWGCASRPPLIKAAYDGDVQHVQALLKEGLDVNMKGGTWDETALNVAAAQGHLDMVKILLDSGADVNAVNKNGESALIGATWGCHRKIAMLLISHGANLNFRNPGHGSTALTSAVECDDLNLVNFLIDNGADVTVSKKSGITPLMTAVWQNNAKIAESLIEAGADIEAAWSDGGSPLYEAAANGFDSIAKLLIDKGANVNYVSKYIGWTPLMIAVAENHFAIVSSLIEAGADLHVRDHNGFTPLIMAVYNGNAPIVKLLCESEADVNAKDANGWTPLQFASSYAYTDVVAVLMMHNASVDVTNKDGHDALWYAEKSKNEKIIQMLKNPNPDFIASYTQSIKTVSISHHEKRIENATVEIVRKEKPLEGSYRNMVINRFGRSDRLKGDYPEAATHCRQAVIDHLRHKKTYAFIMDKADSPYPNKTVLIDGLIEDMHLSGRAGRILFGPLAGSPFMDVRIKLTDAETKTVIHEIVISTNTNAWLAGVTMGTSDIYLPVGMGELIGEYLYTIVPAEGSVDNKSNS